MGSRNLYCDAKFMQSGSSQTLIKVEGDRSMSLKYRIGRDNYAMDGADEDWNEIPLPIFALPFPSPNMNIAKKGPEVINNFTIMMFHADGSIPQPILSHVFSTCSHLTSIEVSVNGSKFKAEPCGEGMVIATNDSLTQQNLTSIKLTGDWKLSASLLDLITTYTPNIAVLLCRGGCKYIGEKNESRIKHTVLDLRQLKNLKKFHVQMSIYDFKFVKFSYFSSDIVGNTTDKYYKITLDISDDGEKKHYSITPTSFDAIVDEHIVDSEEFDNEYNKQDDKQDSTNRDEEEDNTDDSEDNTNDGEDNTNDSEDNTDDSEENRTNTKKRFVYTTKIP